ncbi:hypothetical protein M9Y10_006535 [Tritrichomonas musculus]|uniref:Kelch motif family protein n=1 Tax=Tritrichomonas musculus TaxID=1915356 RepID=A0ABR2JGG5_9EUKA
MGNAISNDPDDSKYFSSSDDEEKEPPKTATKFVKMGTENEVHYLDTENVSLAESDENINLSQVLTNRAVDDGIWSIVLPPNKGPSPRTGHFFVYCSDYQTIFTGYGIKRSGKLLNDVWALSTVDFSWHKLRLTGDKISPRRGSSAIMMDNYIVIFGGCDETRHYTDLHTIDVTTGQTLIAETGGQVPPAQKGCAIGIYHRKLYIFGGSDGEETFDNLYILDFDTMNWSLIRCSIDIGESFAFAPTRHHIYCYGASKVQALTVIDMKKQTVYLQDLNCQPPPAGVQGAGMVRAGEYLFFFGGHIDKQFTKMYCGNIKKNQWFIFYVGPDGESTSMADGKVSKEGFFLLPDVSDFACAYVPENRQILAFFGHPHKSPVPVFVVSIGNALSKLNLREDMVSMLYFYD